MSLQITGEEDVLDALKKGVEIKLVLVDREEDCSEIIELCNSMDIRVVEGSSTDLWRMSANGQQKVLALIEREPLGTLEEVFEREGAIWLFDGVEYAPNLGFGVTFISPHSGKTTCSANSYTGERSSSGFKYACFCIFFLSCFSVSWISIAPEGSDLLIL